MANEKQGFLGNLAFPSTGSIRRPLKGWNNADGKISPRCCQGTGLKKRLRKVIEKLNVGLAII